MAKNITRHVQHIKSVDTTTITVDGQDVIVAKLPEWGDLKDGEIAVNYKDGYETISIRNNNNEVVAFPNINTVNTLIEEKAQAALIFDTTPTANSTNPVTSDGIKTYVDAGDSIQSLTTYQSSTPLAVGDTHDQALSKLSKIIDDNEIITARALTDLNDTKQDEIEDLDEIRTGAALGATALQTETQLSKGTTSGDGNAVTDISVNNHQITLTKGATFLTEHQDLSAYADGAEYDSAEHLIYLKHGNTRLANPINAADFIKDGMVDTVTVTGGNLVITFNTDSGKEDIEILLSDIFDPSLYYTKEEIDEHELVTAAALTELHDTKADKVALNDLNTNKQDKLEFDDTPTAGSDNPVTSNGIKTYVDNANKITTLEEPTVSTPLAVGDTYDTAFGKLTKIIRDNEFTTAGALTELHETKQELLTFDSTPTANSTNPVTSGGIKEYVDDAIDATDDTLVIECSGDLEENKSEAIAGNTLTITNGVTAADIVEAHTEGKKIEIRHTFIQSGHVDSGELITCVITTTKSAIENDAVGVIGIGISTAPIMASLFRSDYRAGYILNATHDEQDSSNDSVIIGGYVEDHPVLSEIDYINRVANLIFSSDGMDGYEFKPTFRFYDTSNPNGGVVAYLSDLESITSMTEITYSDLVTARNNNNLKPGTWYRITDYTTTTTQANTQSAGHNFDVIVLATSSNMLSEEARAIQHSGDTYFANSNLNAWKIWYCLENNKTKYNWADDSIDEDVIEINSLIGADNKTYTADGTITVNGVERVRYKPSDAPYRNMVTIEEPIVGVTIYATNYTASNRATLGAAETTITSIDSTITHEGTNLPNGRGVIYRLIDEWGNDCPYDFKNIQFKRKLRYNTSIVNFYVYDETNGTDTWVYTFNAGFGETLSDNSLGLNLNILGGNGIVGLCFNNTILPCYDAGNYSNIIAGTAGEIILNDTVFLSMVPGNTNYLLGLATFDNSIDVNNRNNTLYGNNLTIGKGFEYNAFLSVSLFAQVDSGNSTFGNGCKHFNVTEPMDNCTFGNNVQYFSVTQTADGGYKNIIVENGVKYVTLDVSGSTGGIIQNITIAQGVAGDSNNTKVIYHNTANDNFRTTYQSANSQVVSV